VSTDQFTGHRAFVCAWCRAILLDNQHAREHGPLCPKSPVVPAVRAASLLDAAEIADTEAWRHAWIFVDEGEEGARGACSALVQLAGTFRVLAAVALELLR
jgi:hypothetical protein